MAAAAPRDPTRIREQPALTTSSGAIWLIVGALFAVIAIGVLLALATRVPAGPAIGAAVAVAVLYLGMVVVRLAVPAYRRRLRLGLMAVLMLTMAAVSLGTVLVLAELATVR